MPAASDFTASATRSSAVARARQTATAAVTAVRSARQSAPMAKVAVTASRLTVMRHPVYGYAAKR
jgi:hypothetical protein